MMMRIQGRRPFSSRSRRRDSSGFTLLEVLLAVVIFSIVVSAIYNTFNITSHAFQEGRASSEAMQTMRIAIDQITRDLRSVYYETTYDLKFKMLEHELIRNEDQLLKDLRDGVGHTVANIPTGLDDTQDPADYSLGQKIDLSFEGKTTDEGASLKFTHYVESDADEELYHGLERVHYFISNGDLYRQRKNPAKTMRLAPDLADKITEANNKREQLDLTNEERHRIELVRKRYGEPPPGLGDPYRVEYFKEMPTESPPPELLAQNVVSFDMKFGYFFEEWQEAGDWDSEAKKYRTPGFNLEPTDQEFEHKLLSWQTRPTDGLPSYVRITLTVSKDPKDKDTPSGRSVETTVWIPTALETYVPGDETYFQHTETKEGYAAP